MRYGNEENIFSLKITNQSMWRIWECIPFPIHIFYKGFFIIEIQYSFIISTKHTFLKFHSDLKKILNILCLTNKCGNVIYTFLHTQENILFPVVLLLFCNIGDLFSLGSKLSIKEHKTFVKRVLYFLQQWVRREIMQIISFIVHIFLKKEITYNLEYKFKTVLPRNTDSMTNESTWSLLYFKCIADH